MERGSPKTESVDEYIASFPDDVQEKLRLLRKTIKETAPEAEEGISYGMPGYKLHGPLVYFAGFKNHIGFYPTPSGIESFEKELSKYKQGKGSVQFPLDQPVPVALVKKMVKFRIKQNEEKAGRKAAKGRL